MDENSGMTVDQVGVEAPSAAANATTVDAPVIEKITVDTPVDPILAANQAAAEAINPVTENVAETVSATQPEAAEAVNPVTETVTEPAPAMTVQSASDYFADAFSGGFQAQENAQASQDAAAGTNTSGASTSGGWQPYGVTNGTSGAATSDVTGNASAGSGVFDYYGYNSSGAYGQGAGYAQGTGYSQGTGYGQPQGYGQDPSYGQNPGYGQATAYGQNPGYGYAQGADFSQSPFGQTPDYSGSSTPGYLQNGSAQGGYMYGATDEYSQPSYGFQAAYGNDPFASYYDEDVPQRPSNGLAIGALVCGIVSLVMTCSYVGFIPGIIAIILGINGSKKSGNPRMATIGMILGILGTVTGLIAVIGFFANIAGELSKYF